MVVHRAVVHRARGVSQGVPIFRSGLCERRTSAAAKNRYLPLAALLRLFLFGNFSPNPCENIFHRTELPVVVS